MPLILDLLDRLGVPATFFVPGRVAERHAQQVRDVVAAGDELAHHGYTHTHPGRLTRSRRPPSSPSRWGCCGASLRRRRLPVAAWDFSEATMSLLAEHGIAYSSNLMDDILPYRHPNGVVELPVQWILDDAPHFWFSNADWTKPIRSARDVLQIWQEEAARIDRLGGLCVLALHPQIIGRPGRLAMLEEFLRWVLDQGDVRVARCAEIAAGVA